VKPATINLTIYQGSTFTKDYIWKVGEPAIPVNLTGYTAKMQIREKISEATILIELSTENGRILIPNPIEGHFSFLISATDTSMLSFKNAVYDLELYSPSGVVRRLFGGSVTLSPEVTR